jgi:hypothetical protein
LAQAEFLPQGGPYSIAGTLIGDQVGARVAVGPAGGVVVWQDNATDEDGLGISARRLGSGFSGLLGSFRVNEIGTGDQENPQVAMGDAGLAAFVWQGGPLGNPDVYLRILRAEGSFEAAEQRVNTYTEGPQSNPAVAILKNGSIVVVWASHGQDGSLSGVFGQRFTAAGERIGSEFQVNQGAAYNQKSPTVAPLENGGFVVAWLTEQPTAEVNQTDETGGFLETSAGATLYRVDVAASLFSADGLRVKPEYRLNSKTGMCAEPQIVGLRDGGFAVAWSYWNEPANALVPANRQFPNGWDIFYRAFDAQASPRYLEVRVNAHASGDQFAPTIAGRADEQMVVWSSVGQEGFLQGVYGRFVNATGGRLLTEELRVNTSTAAAQLQPSVASDSAGRFLVVWSTFVGGTASYDLTAQRYSGGQPLVPPSAPYVSALSQTRISVTWAEMSGLGVAQVELMMDDRPPVVVEGNSKEFGSLAPGSSHTFQLAYVLTDGRRSPWSAPASGKTWSEDENFDGLPDDWQAQYWGGNRAGWPAGTVDSDGDGASNLQEFLAGTHPLDAASVLRTRITPGGQSPRLVWNTHPGLMYLVQSTQDFADWSNVGSPRLAAGETDSIQVDGAVEAKYFRVLRMR